MTSPSSDELSDQRKSEILASMAESMANPGLVLSIHDMINTNAAYMNLLLYGTSHYEPPSYLEKMRVWVSRFFRRARDAWLVLTGQISLEDY